MQHQNRAWVFTHLKTLHAVWKTQFVATLTSGREVDSHRVTIKIDHMAMMIMNKLQDIYINADLYLRPRTDGFITADMVVHPALANIADDKRTLNEAYRKLETQRQEGFRAAIKQVLDMRVAATSTAAGLQEAFMAAPNLLVNREFAHKSLQPEIEEPLTREVEPWVCELSGAEVERFGFVAYRLVYKENEEEWKKYLEKMRDGLGSGWEGVVGANGVRSKARLHWVDGSKEGIAEGDVEGARQ